MAREPVVADDEGTTYLTSSGDASFALTGAPSAKPSLFSPDKSYRNSGGGRQWRSHTHNIEGMTTDIIIGKHSPSRSFIHRFLAVYALGLAQGFLFGYLSYSHLSWVSSAVYQAEADVPNLSRTSSSTDGNSTTVSDDPIGIGADPHHYLKGRPRRRRSSTTNITRKNIGPSQNVFVESSLTDSTSNTQATKIGEDRIEALSMRNATLLPSKPPKYGLSVVRCTGNTTWVKTIPPDWGLMIFEKCGQTLDERYSVDAKNEADAQDLSSHMLFITTHYHNLPDVSIFMQDDGLAGYQLSGRTCPHTPYSTLDELKQDVDRYLDGGFLNIGATAPLTERLFTEPYFGPHSRPMLEFMMDKEAVTKLANFSGTEDPPIRFVHGSHWAVSKDRILRHPFETYQNIHDYIMWNEGAEARARACALERLLHVLFGEKILMPDTKMVRGFRNMTQGCSI